MRWGLLISEKIVEENFIEQKQIERMKTRDEQKKDVFSFVIKKIEWNRFIINDDMSFATQTKDFTVDWRKKRKRKNDEPEVLIKIEITVQRSRSSREREIFSNRKQIKIGTPSNVVHE